VTHTLAACAFCRIVAKADPAEQVWQDERAIVIVPLNPVVPGHVIAIPRRHADDFTEDWLTTSDAMHAAFQYARAMGGPFNLITSRGREATQSVFHLHVHLVPRAAGDGLALPWTSAAAELRGAQRQREADVKALRDEAARNVSRDDVFYKLALGYAADHLALVPLAASPEETQTG